MCQERTRSATDDPGDSGCQRPRIASMATLACAHGYGCGGCSWVGATFSGAVPSHHRFTMGPVQKTRPPRGGLAWQGRQALLLHARGRGVEHLHHLQLAALGVEGAVHDGAGLELQRPRNAALLAPIKDHTSFEATNKIAAYARLLYPCSLDSTIPNRSHPQSCRIAPD